MSEKERAPTIPGYYICRSTTQPSAVYAVRLDLGGSVQWNGNCDGEWLGWNVVAGPYGPPRAIGAITAPDILGVHWCEVESATGARSVDAVSVYFADNDVRCRTCTGGRVVRWGQRVWP